jgi:hypothetical protein
MDSFDLLDGELERLFEACSVSATDTQSELFLRLMRTADAWGNLNIFVGELLLRLSLVRTADSLGEFES